MIVLQRSQEWHEQRKLRLTGSRIGAILGLSPWQTPENVLRQMVREYHGAPNEWVSNPATDWGNQHETRALLAFMRKTGLQVEQCGFFAYGDRMGASPDGLTSDGGVLELKAPYGLRHGGEFKPLAGQPHYAAQVQMEMLATGRNHAYFAQYRAPHGDPLAHDYLPEAMEIECVEFDPAWIDNVLPDLDWFYKRLLAELENEDHLNPLRVAVDTPEAGLLLGELDILRQRQKDDAEREKAIIAELVALAGDKNALVHGRKLTKTKDGKTVAYAKALAELAPGADLSKWESGRKGGWRLS